MWTKEQTSEYNKKYHTENKEKIALQQRNHRLDNIEKFKEKDRIYAKIHVQQKAEYNKKYWKENKEKLIVQNKKYKLEHSEELKKYWKNYRGPYRKEKRKIDSLFKLSCNIRSRIYCGLKRRHFSKKQRTIDFLGCSFSELKVYLENKFTPSMTWENYGSHWEVDHIVPLCTSINEEEMIKLNHYTNLQPLETRLNRTKYRTNYNKNI